MRMPDWSLNPLTAAGVVFGLTIVLLNGGLWGNFAGLGIASLIAFTVWAVIHWGFPLRGSSEADANAEHQHLWLTLMSIGDGVIVTDSAGCVKLVNPVARELIGCQADVIGASLPAVFQLINDMTRQPIESPVDQALTAGRVVAIANHAILLRADGTEVPIEATIAPIREDSGRRAGVILVFRDCSSRRRAEATIMEREFHFRQVFESPLIGIAIGTYDGYLLEANDAYLNLVGYSRGEVDESSLSWGGVPAGQSPFDDQAEREIRENHCCTPFERTLAHADGRQIPVLVSAAKLSDEHDRVVVFVTDLTQSKQAQAALRESEARFRVLSECMPQKVWTARPNGELDYLNHMLMDYAGLTPEQLKGWGWTQLIHPDDTQIYLETWRQALATGHMFEIEHRFLRHTGEWRWHLARALPMYDADSQIAMWVGTQTDIHDRKQAEEELRDEHRRKDQFLALLAHELRNPLAPLSNALQVFSAVQNDSGRTAELLAIMQRQVHQMTRLIDDLLDLARVTRGRIQLRRERVSAETLVGAAVEAVQPLMADRRHQLAVTLPPEDLWLDMDVARIVQILTNLLHNAAKYTGQHGQISLTVKRDGDDALFLVCDNGPGISREMLTKIFDLFMQVEQTLDRAHGGLGIGLTLVRTLTELHGGTVAAYSEGPGRGSAFEVRLPLANEQLQPVTVCEDESSGVRTPLALLRVMVVDDVQASAKTLALMIKTLGPQVEMAFDGATAIMRTTSEHFDVVFLDIAMPGLDGLEVARLLRTHRELDPLILVALTGFGQEDDRRQALAAGFNDHLTKPTSLEQLTYVLERAVDLRPVDRSPAPIL